MKITAERITGHVFVVAVDEIEALERYAAGNTFDRHQTGDTLNTYKIVVAAEKVH